MKTPFAVLFIALLPLLTFSQSTPHLAITDVTVIDMTSRTPLTGMTVLIDGDRIIKIGRFRSTKFPKAASGHGDRQVETVNGSLLFVQGWLVTALRPVLLRNLNAHFAIHEKKSE
jgi:hypothetical protein